MDLMDKSINRCFLNEPLLTLREGMTVCDLLHQTGRLQSMDLVEINPRLASGLEVQRTVQAGLHLIYSALGLRDIVSFHA